MICSKVNSLLLKISALVLLAVSFGLRFRLLFIRRFDADEFEYLRGAFYVFNGWLPYKDFFEHHTPLFFYLLSPLFLLGENPDLIFIGRLVMLFLTILIVFLIFRVARVFYGSAVAWITSVWLSFIFIFFEKTLEIRPLLPALVFFLSGTLLIAGSGGKASKNRSFSAGIMYSLAFLCTQKIIFLLIGVGLAFLTNSCLEPRSSTRHKPDLRPAGLMLSGFLLPLALFLLYFWLRGGLKDFIYRNLIMNLMWKRREPLATYLISLAYENPFLFFWSIWGWVATGFRLLTGKEANNHLLIWSPASMGVVGLLVTPIVFGQYYALLVPLFAILAAKGFFDFLRRFLNSSGRKRIAGCFLIFLSGPGLLWLISYVLVLKPHRFWENLRLTNPLFIVGGALTCFLLGKAEKARMKDLALILLALLIVSRPLNFIFQEHRDRNYEQIKVIKTIIRQTGPADRVMDGWEPTGSLFRLPAYYYHFLHEGVLMMMSPEEKGEELLLALKKTRPKIIFQGEYLESLSPGVRDYLGFHYRTHHSEPTLLIRK